MKNGKTTVIMKDCHCPYCEKDKAVLINKEAGKKWSLQFPAFGIKFMLSVVYLSFIYIYRYGMKLFEVVRKNDILTYCFCPECGNSYSLDPPKNKTELLPDDKLYRYREGGLIKGICKGISVLTEIPLLWIRICTVLYGVLEIYLCTTIISRLKFLILPYKLYSSNVFSVMWMIIGIVVSAAVVFGEYILLSLLLKEKRNEYEDEQGEA